MTVVGQLALGRHLEEVVPDGVDDQALVDLARHDRRPAVAAAEQALAAVEPQTALELAPRLAPAEWHP